MLVTYAVIDDSPGLLKIAGLLCAGAFQMAVIADISVSGKISVFLIPFSEFFELVCSRPGMGASTETLPLSLYWL